MSWECTCGRMIYDDEGNCPDCNPTDEQILERRLENIESRLSKLEEFEKKHGDK